MDRPSPVIIAILRALSKEQLRSFDKFMHSPYHVTHEGVLQWYEWLKNHLHEEVWDKKAMQEAIFTQKEKNEPRRIYHLNNYLLEALENFLALEDWLGRKHEQHAATIAALRDLKLAEESAAMLRYARKRLNASPQRGSAWHRAEYLLQQEAYHGSLQQGRAKSFNAQELSDAQDLAFICEKLRTGCLLLSHEAVANQTYDKGLLDSVLNSLKGHRYLEIPVVAAYYHGYYSQAGGDDSAGHFTRLKAILEKHAPRFSMSETHDLYLIAINFCIRRINQREERFFQEVFDLYQSGLRYGALLEGGTLSRWTYNNVTVAGLRLKAFEQVWQFLHEYAPLLPREHREGALHFNLAKYHYELGELPAAMQHLLLIGYDDVLQNLVAKTMLCKIYYELDETDSLENQLDSIQIYLRRQKVLGYHRDNYLAIVRFFRKLLKVNWNNRSEIAALREEILAAPVLTEREWLLKQVEL
ncbi:MAG: hypothetical protein SFV22_14810 [Saprospiraceae bacterium]|nr:hypothetical protein [Saprospiraceae bacterium]